MATSLYDLSVGAYTQILGAAQNVLAKGAEYCGENGIDLDAVVESRLIDDMANFHFQVVCIYHHSLEAVRALQSGEFRPPNYDACDYAALQALIAKGLDELGQFSADEINALEDGKLLFKIGGNEIPFTNENFINSFSLPNLYFHTTTAYDILRMKGVPLGKMDYLGALKMG